MNILCERTCQVRVPGGKIRFVDAGVVIAWPDGEDVPDHFISVTDPDHEVDFATASEDELMNFKWSAAEAREALQELYGVELKINQGDSKETVVGRIIDIRYRAADAPKKVNG